MSCGYCCWLFNGASVVLTQQLGSRVLFLKTFQIGVTHSFLIRTKLEKEGWPLKPSFYLI